MSSIFLKVLNTSIAASWVVLAVILVRLLLRKAPRSMLCWLWWLVGARLWLGETFETPFSLIPSLETITPESMYDTTPVITSGVAVIDNVVNPIYTNSFATDGFASVNPLQIWTAVAANIWLLGMIVIWMWAIISWFRLRRRVAASISLRDNIYLCDDIDTPFILGMFMPKIYLPSTLEDPQRGHVIAHEEAHIQRMDYHYKPVAYFLLSIFWFNPMMWVAYILLCRDIELACDERVIKSMTAEEKKGYSTALLECSIHRHMIAACPLAFGEVGVKERVKAVLNYKKPAFWIILIAVIVSFVMTLGFLTDPETRPAELRYNGSLYELEHQEVSFLPVEEETIGDLRSILHDTTDHPTEDFQATNLDESLAGCPLYQEQDRIYLQKMDGTCMAFRLKSPNSLVENHGSVFSVYRYTVYTENTREYEEIVYGSGGTDPYAAMIDGLYETDFAPGRAEGTELVNLDVDTSGELKRGISLALYDSGQWELTVHKESFGESVYTFESGELDAWAAPLLGRADYFSSVYAECAPEKSPLIFYHTLTDAPVVLQFGLPQAWTFETLTDRFGDDHVAFRFRPPEVRSGGVSVYYYPEGAEVSLPGGIPVGQQETVTFSSGLSGTKITPEGSESWSAIVFDTTEGSLFAVTEDVDSWWTEHGGIATGVLGSITVNVAGESVLTPQNPFGIKLSARNVTPNGLTLICTQDGTWLEELTTGSYYSVSVYEDGHWIPLDMPEGTAWTMEAWVLPLGETYQWRVNWNWLYGELPPGRYRIGKSFTGRFPNPESMYLPAESVNQTYYAEFTIE